MTLNLSIVSQNPPFTWDVVWSLHEYESPPLERSCVRFLLASCHDPGAPPLFFFPRGPLCPLSPSRVATLTSLIKAACAEEVSHIKGGEPCVVAGLPPPALILPRPDLRDKASIRRHQNTRQHRKRRFPPSLRPSLFAGLLDLQSLCFFGELFLPGQLLLLWINLNHPHGDEGNSRMRANRGRLDWIY